MFDNTFTALFAGTADITVTSFLICIGAALVLGIVMALSYGVKTPCTASFSLTLALLPAIVCVVIMMVGGNLGTGVAVAGTFSLVRFRSVPGTAKEICAVFLSMAVGLACGMGYPGFAALFAVIMIAAMLLLQAVNFGGKRDAALRKVLRITVPEDLDYGDAFRGILEQYTAASRLTSVKTTNLGSLIKLTYDVTLKKAGTERVLIDDLRCRNGNLEISISTETMDVRDL